MYHGIVSIDSLLWVYLLHLLLKKITCVLLVSPYNWNSSMSKTITLFLTPILKY